MKPLSRPTYKATIVHFSSHAVSRWQERIEEPFRARKVKSEILSRLFPALRRQGRVRLNRLGRFGIQIRPGVYVVLAPSAMGGWDVLTFYCQREGVARDEASRSTGTTGEST